MPCKHSLSLLSQLLFLSPSQLPRFRNRIYLLSSIIRSQTQGWSFSPHTQLPTFSRTCPLEFQPGLWTRGQELFLFTLPRALPSFFFFFLISSLLPFFPLSFSPLIPPPTSNHHTVVHVHESFFFLLGPSTPNLPAPLTGILLPIYESVSVLLISSVCSLDSTQEWNLAGAKLALCQCSSARLRQACAWDNLD